MTKLRHSIRLKAVLLSAVLCLTASCSEKNDGSSESVTPEIPQVVASASLATPEIEQHDINALTGLAPIEGQQEGTRPIAIMIDNVEKALPQTGISLADVIYEAETEAGMTRFLALYSDPNSVIAAGPVTALRTHFAELAMAQNAVLVNIGTVGKASNLLNYFGYQNIDGEYTGTTTFNFDLPRSYEKGNEYSWYTNNSLIATGITANAISPIGGYNPLFNFAEEDVAVSNNFEGVAKTSVKFNFSDIATGEFAFNSSTNSYDKYFNGAAQLDSIEQKPLSFENVFILFCDVSLGTDNISTEFVLTQGEGVYVNGGKYANIKWQKGSPDDQLRIIDDNGEDILVHTGKSYIAFVSNLQKETLVIS